MRVAAFQRRPLFDAPAAAGEVLCRDLRWADERGVDLALFPECFLHGHAYDRATVARRAVRLDGPEVGALLERLAPARATAVVGLFERRPNGVFNSAVVLRGGRVLGVYAKAHPNEEGVTAGAEFPVFTHLDRPFGVNVCNDANYPPPARRLAHAGAALICYPLNNLLRPETADRWRTRHLTNLTARARETACWVVSADVAGRHGDRVSYGCTAVVRPDGTVAARVPELEEGVVLHDVD